jgi:hypothetical protein
MTIYTISKYLINFFRYLFSPKLSLFDGNDYLFITNINSAKIYGEYGCGTSTIYVALNSDATILSVDTSQDWINSVSNKLSGRGEIKLHYANVGVVGEWGTPINYKNYSNFNEYTDWIWKQDLSPDIVLIDGRFRVCCFLTSLLFAKEGTKLIFDDYTNREYYHIVEMFIQPSITSGRQALFIVPNKNQLNIEKINIFINNFRFVID